MAISNGLISLEDAKASIFGNPAPTGTTDDADLELYIEAATPVIERITGPLIERTETYTLDGGGSAVSLPVRFTSVESVEVDGVETTAYVADLEAGIVYALGRFAPGVQNVVVEVTVGYAVEDGYPANVVLAARELVRHWWQQGRQGNRPAFGNEFTDSPAVSFGVPTRRLQELLDASSGLAGFA